MNNQELKNITDVIIKNCDPSKIGEVLLSVVSMADKTTLNNVKEQNTLYFTNKEIDKMPQKFKNEFRIDGCTAKIYIRKTSSGYTYDIKYRRHGYNVSVTAKTLNSAKEKFINALANAEPKGQNAVPSNFNDFSKFYFENFRKKKVTEATLKNDMSRYNCYLLPAFGSMQINKITPVDCQKLIDGIKEKGKGKTAEEIHSLLSVIFKCAINHDLIRKSPLDTIIYTKHEREHGEALSNREIEMLKEIVSDSYYRDAIMVALYTGVRPNELETIQIKDNMIIAVNSKQKNKKVEYKRIPICKMLEPFIKNGFTCPSVQRLRDYFKSIFPKHKLYDLRTTFYSKCKECGLEIYAIEEYMGHSLGAVGNSYTDLSDDYLVQEMKKLNF